MTTYHRPFRIARLCLGLFLLLSLDACLQARARRGMAVASQGAEESFDTSIVARMQILTKHGGRVAWSHALNRIAYDHKGADGYYDVFTMKPDGSDPVCVTCDIPDLPHTHVGQPAWHPSGRYLVVQVSKPDCKCRAIATAPGLGHCNDIWIVDLDKKHANPLRVVPDGKDFGVLHPHFSEDGKRLSWAEMTAKPNRWKSGLKFGSWKEMVADVDFSGKEPALRNIREYQPGDNVWYENHGFTPDGSGLLFTSNFKRDNVPQSDSNLFILDLKRKQARQLTFGGYNEHGHFSPDGRWIIWMSSRGNAKGDTTLKDGTDWWIMRSDGTDKRRITGFNLPGSPHYTGATTLAADLSWGPDSKSFVGYYAVWHGLLKPAEEVIVRIDLALPEK